VSYEWAKQWLEEEVRQAREEQQELKSLTDEELMELEDHLIFRPNDERSDGDVAALGPPPDVKLRAVMYEIDRRYRAAAEDPQERSKWDTWGHRHLDKHGKLLPWAILGVLGYQNSIESLCQALNHPEEFVRGQAAAALGDLGDCAAVPALLDALHDESSSVRGHCIVSLMEFKDERTVARLIDLLKDDDSEVRGLAAAALSELGDGKAVKPLMEALNDVAVADREKDKAAPYILLGLERLCKQTDVPVIIDALRRFGESFLGVAAILLRALCDENDAPYLKSIIRDESESVRVVAAAVLAALGDDSGLAHLLDDASEQGRRVALAAAALVGSMEE